MRPHSWVIIANGVTVRLIQAENLQKMQEIETLHLSDYISEEDMPSDQKGELNQRMGPAVRHAMEPRTLPKEKFAHIFAKKIAEKMEEGQLAGKFDWIYLFASPHFLGILRKELHPNVAKVVVAEFNKDLIHADFNEIKKNFSF